MISRRHFLERTSVSIVAGATVSLGGTSTDAKAKAAPAVSQPFRSRFDAKDDRVWLGPEYWANPMEDWRVAEGRLECVSTGGNRNVHLLTREIGAQRGSFTLSVRAGLIEKRALGSVGFRIGVRDAVNDYRSNCIFGRGLDAGIVNGSLRLGNTLQKLDGDASMDDLHIHLSGEPSQGDGYALKLTVRDGSGRVVGAVAEDNVAAVDLIGSVALVNNFEAKAKAGSRFWFADW